MKTTYTTYGTCSRFIDIELTEDAVAEIRFIGGCSGNAQGISKLVQGMPIAEVIERLKGIVCRGGTSCPDQLAQALQQLLQQKSA